MEFKLRIELIKNPDEPIETAFAWWIPVVIESVGDSWKLCIKGLEEMEITGPSPWHVINQMLDFEKLSLTEGFRKAQLFMVEE